MDQALKIKQASPLQRAYMQQATPSDATFCRARMIRFSDCDPAGIVFYPQYFVMFNGLVEDWVEEGLGIGHRHLIMERRIGLPTVRLEADFCAVSKMGDAVQLCLTVLRLGTRSLTLQLQCVGADGEIRMQMQQVLVATSLVNHRSVDIPPDMRGAIESSLPGHRWVEPTGSS